MGYVTYKWPEWLRQQTEKQRIIWGYKILFLDVLFPLNVSKVSKPLVSKGVHGGEVGGGTSRCAVVNHEWRC